MKTMKPGEMFNKFQKRKMKKKGNPNSPENYGKAMDSAYASKYGKPTFSARKRLGMNKMMGGAKDVFNSDNKNTSPLIGGQSTPQAKLKKKKKALRSADAVVKSEQNASRKYKMKCKTHKKMKCKMCAK